MDGAFAPTASEAANLLDSGVQEVRLAASFSGGVSLAVWMGGVACELGRLCASSPVAPPPGGGGDRGDEVYRGLLALTRSTPAVDVLAGTSAGGINGAALALALARGGDVAPLRDVWLDHGSLDALLRPVGALDPPSLLLGDDHLGRRLSEAMTEIATKGDLADAPPWTTRLRLTVTTTLTTPYGEPDWHDAFGEPIAVNQHLGLMRFGHRDLVADAAVGRLAVAARASASYPGGFEAASIPVGRDHDIEGFPRPSMTGVAQWDGDAWALDGGLLLNEPLEVILDDVYGQPAGSPTRRFLLHITPTPGAPRASRLARPAEPPPLLGVLWAARDIPGQQNLARELRRIRAHNDSVAARKALRRRLLTSGLLPEGDEQWDRPRLEQAALAVLDALVEAQQADPSPMLGRHRHRVTEILQRCQQSEPTPPPDALVDEVASLAGELGLVSGDPATARRPLLAMAAVLVTGSQNTDLVEQRLELVQLSAAAWTGVTGDALTRRRGPRPGARPPDRKLRGIELARFSSFVKRSWRANDWMWGRLDAGYHLCRLLLDPARLREVAAVDDDPDAAADAIVSRLRGLAVPSDPAWAAVLADDVLPADQRWEPVVRAEVRAIVTGASDQLVWTPCWVARRLHLQMLAEELPVVAGCITADEREGAHLSSHARRFRDLASVDGNLTPGATLAAFGAYRVHTERLRQQLAAPLGRSLRWRAGAVGIAALGGARGGVPAGLRWPFALLRPLAAAAATFSDDRRHRRGILPSLASALRATRR